MQKFIHLPNLLPEAINDIFGRNNQIHDHNTRNKIDLFDIVTNVVTKLNSQIVYQKVKPKRKFKFPCGICDKVSIKIRNPFTAATVVSR